MTSHKFGIVQNAQRSTWIFVHFSYCAQCTKDINIVENFCAIRRDALPRRVPKILLYHILQILSIGNLHKLLKKFFPEFVQNREKIFSKLHKNCPHFLYVSTNFSLFCTKF